MMGAHDGGLITTARVIDGVDHVILWPNADEDVAGARLAEIEFISWRIRVLVDVFKTFLTEDGEAHGMEGSAGTHARFSWLFEVAEMEIRHTLASLGHKAPRLLYGCRARGCSQWILGHWLSFELVQFVLGSLQRDFSTGLGGSLGDLDADGFERVLGSITLQRVARGDSEDADEQGGEDGEGFHKGEDEVGALMMIVAFDEQQSPMV